LYLKEESRRAGGEREARRGTVLQSRNLKEFRESKRCHGEESTDEKCSRGQIESRRAGDDEHGVGRSVGGTGFRGIGTSGGVSFSVPSW